MDSVEIQLDGIELSWCLYNAEKIVEHYAKKCDVGSGSYKHNKVSSNLVGFKSEVGTKKWLLQHIDEKDLICHYENYLEPNSLGDIIAFDNSLEVKGLRPHQWDKYKRCIPPRQLEKYVKNNSIAIWTTTTGDIENPTVVLKGWNYCSEVKEHGKFIHTICPNIWLEDDSKMRAMESLIEVLKGDFNGL